jgi:beta-lactamase regulating signal transducer with metallopeptidase domain/predicted  nucleic acid-binding Zn-ribbon protein
MLATALPFNGTTVLEALERLWATAWSGMWMGALAATMVAAVVFFIVRQTSVRPATRHALWFAVLATFLTPTVAATVWRPTWFASERLVDAAPAPRAVPHAERASGTPSAGTSVPADGRLSETLGVSGSPLFPQDSAKSATGSAGRQAKPPLPSDSRTRADVTRPARTGSVCEPCVANVTLQGDGSSVGEPASNEVASHEAAPASDRCTGDLPSTTESVDELLAASTIRVPDHTLAGWANDALTSAPAPSSAAPLLPNRSALQLWFTRVIGLRDAIAALPPLPLAVWAIGALAVAAIYVRRITLLRRIVRRAVPAAPHVEAEVASVAASLGLEHVPTTLISDEPISPLVWCGWRPRIVLPADLWESFDRSARRTVLVHELAHLRRGDHRILWLEAAVATLYWWHPIAWWARARLRDAAEAACDTWVTSVCPQNRRNYAEAIVLASGFLSNTTGRTQRAQEVACAAVSVGSVSGRSRRLARRITMIMTSRSAPRMSLIGASVAIIALGLGAFVAPGLACPPSDCADNAQALATKAAAEAKAAEKAAERAAQSAAKGRAKASRRAAQSGPFTTTVPPAAASAGGSPFLGEAPAIDAMGSTSAGGQGATGGAFGVTVIGPNGLAGVAAPLQGTAPQAWIQGGVVAAPDEGTTRRRYVLPEGKLDALIELMAREDVPVFIENAGDAIILHGTPRQHEIFSAFLAMINPGQKSARAGITMESLAGPLPSSRALQERQVALARGQAELNKLRADLNHAVAERAALEREAEKLREAAERTREKADELRETQESLAERQANFARFGDANAERAIRDAARTLESSMRNVEREANTLDSQANSAENRMESIENAIERLEARLEALEEALSEQFSDEDETMVDEALLEEAMVDEIVAPDLAEPSEPAEVVDTIALPPAAPSLPSPPSAPAPATPPVPAVAPTAPAGR